VLNFGVLVIPMVPTTPKRAFVLVSGFYLPSPCSRHLRTPKSSTERARFRCSDCSLATSHQLPYSCSHHLATPKLSMNVLDFGVLVVPTTPKRAFVLISGFCLLPPCPCHLRTPTALPLPPQPQNPEIEHNVLDFRVLTVPWLLLPRPDPKTSIHCSFRGCYCLPLPCHLQTPKLSTNVLDFGVCSQQVFPPGIDTTRRGHTSPHRVLSISSFVSVLFLAPPIYSRNTII